MLLSSAFTTGKTTMPAVKIIAKWLKQENDIRLDSTLEFVAAIDSRGHIKPEQRVYGVITGYGYGSLPPGDYSFISSTSVDKKALAIDWGRDYQQFSSTIDVLERHLKSGEIITHVEKPGTENTYDYEITAVTYFE
ncbi:hypothetical protein LRS40_19375 [Leclercia sp. G3L]|uniref:hypothetical protein n=2 Tax=unclassified Leclercia TaxID=2627398 RepID=UPI001E2DE44D|nr:hypothetical protein [Leclercia sp. G3L]UGB01802.1 hypothetical protein LRS40_19375 [Leclercia sp. G3L]